MTMFTSLQMLRGDFEGRVHFSQIRSGTRHEVARRWMDAFFGTHVEHASFKATFALHDGPKALPYPGDEGFQRHFIRSLSSNLVGHVRYTRRNLDRLHLRPVFDRTGNGVERWRGQWGVDFANNRINQRRIDGKRGYPEATFEPVTYQTSDIREAESNEQAINAEFLALTDLLLGASAQALMFLDGERKAGRRQLASRIEEEIAKRYGRDIYIFNRAQRHFSGSLYPDDFGRMYAANPARPAPVAVAAGAQARFDEH
jgi:hypothetical protein